MRKYDNFCSSLENLREIYDYQEPYENVVLTGMVGLFEICFEQSWKLMKELLEVHGFAEGSTGSPKLVLKTAYKAGMIRDEQLWLDALQERNNVVHAYHKGVALGIVLRTKAEFYDMFCILKADIEEQWMD